MVKGLYLLPKYFSEKIQNELIILIDSNVWNTNMRRRVQQYGHQYNYTSRQVSSSEILPIPVWGENIIKNILDAGITTKKFDQMIINEYLPGQGISSHIDSIYSFEDEIVSVTLGSACIINFSQKTTNKEYEMLLEPGDLLVMKEEARYEWHHQIKSRKNDVWKGKTIKRERRISITFRKTIKTF